MYKFYEYKKYLFTLAIMTLMSLTGAEHLSAQTIQQQPGWRDRDRQVMRNFGQNQNLQQLQKGGWRDRDRDVMKKRGQSQSQSLRDLRKPGWRDRDRDVMKRRGQDNDRKKDSRSWWGGIRWGGGPGWRDDRDRDRRDRWGSRRWQRRRDKDKDKDWWYYLRPYFYGQRYYGSRDDCFYDRYGDLVCYDPSTRTYYYPSRP